MQDLANEIVGCTRCVRLRAHCRRVAIEKKAAYREETYWGRPVPGFGDPGARLLVVGLAPAAHGANRTGRLFTGDSSGDFLMRGLHAAGFASLPTSRRADDGLRLRDVFITAAVRCAPPGNRPTPDEIRRCLRFLAAELAALGRVRAIIALGRIAFDASLRVLAECGAPTRPRPRFGHATIADLSPAYPRLIGSYHPSRQNTNTGRLTAAMFDEVFTVARSVLEADPRRATTPADAASGTRPAAGGGVPGGDTASASSRRRSDR